MTYMEVVMICVLVSAANDLIGPTIREFYVRRGWIKPSVLEGYNAKS